MVGTLEQAGAWFGLVQDNEGLIHRVQVGNHMGQNYGRILSITENQIALVEIIPDGLGGYLERPAAVSLRD
jgi:type IV pilus assembly protein PilP